MLLFRKRLADGTRIDMVMYVDDGYVVDEHSRDAEVELNLLHNQGWWIQEETFVYYVLYSIIILLCIILLLLSVPAALHDVSA